MTDAAATAPAAPTVLARVPPPGGTGRDKLTPAERSGGLLLTLDDQVAALRRIRQHLAPGGLLVLDVSNGNGRGTEPPDELVLQYEGTDPTTGLPLSKWTEPPLPSTASNGPTLTPSPSRRQLR